MKRETMTNTGYPESVLEVLDDQMQFPPAAIATVQRFAESGPWRGSVDQRTRKFHQLVLDLSRVYGIAPPTLGFEKLDGKHSGTSHYIPAQHRVVLVGKLSVVSALHEFAHVLGMNERGTCRWSINLFRQVWPGQYARLIHVGHTLIRPDDLARRCGDGKPGSGMLAKITTKRKSFEDCSGQSKSGEGSRRASA